MKTSNLKRFMASLLAVVMLFSVVGISPAVFADDAVAPELNAKSGEVLIKSSMTNEEVAEILNKALISNYDELDDATKAALQWEYKGYGYTERIGTKSIDKHWGTINGNAKFTEKHGINYTYFNKALKDAKAGNYQVRLAGTKTEATLVKVDKYTSIIKLKTDASITYNMDAENMKQQIFDNAIDWANSTLPAKETLSVADFTFEYKALPVITDKLGLNEDNFESVKTFVPVEGRKGLTDFTTYVQMGADEEDGQTIKVTYNGNDTYKEGSNEGKLIVNRASVTVTINEPIKIMHAGEVEIKPAEYVSLNPNDPALDVYIVYVGVNTNKQTTVYLQVTGEKEDFVNGVNALLRFFGLPTLNDGMTVGEVKEAVNKALSLVDNKLTELAVNAALSKYGITYKELKGLFEALNSITIADNLLFAIGVPSHAGQYFAAAIAVNDNYKTGISTPGSVTVLKNWKGITLEKNPILDGSNNTTGKNNTITVSEAEALKAGNDLCILTKEGAALDSTSVGSIHYWFTGVGKLYAKSTMPTAPGKYIVTASVRGGDFFAMPKTFTFTIVADPTPEVTPEA